MKEMSIDRMVRHSIFEYTRIGYSLQSIDMNSKKQRL